MDERFEELISAFFDGEATAEQRQQVEQLLAENSDARELLDELAALRTDMKSLPSYQLEKDFAGRVIERIEKAVQDNGEADLGDGKSVALATPTQQPAQQHNDAGDSGLRRGLLWSALAVAAAVLIMVVTGTSDREVAQHDGQSPSADGEAFTETVESGAADMAASSKTAEFNKQASKMTGPAPGEKLRNQLESAELHGQVRAPDSAPASALADEDRDYGNIGNIPGRDPGVAVQGAQGDRGVQKDMLDKAGRVASVQPKNENLNGTTLNDNLSDDSDGVAFFEVARGADLAEIHSIFLSQLEAEKLPAANLARRDQEGKKLARQRREQEKEIPGGDADANGQFDDAKIYLEIKGTSEQISNVLRRFETGQRSVRLVKTDQRLGEMLARTSSTGAYREGLVVDDDEIGNAPVDETLLDDDIASASEGAKRQDLSEPAAPPSTDAARTAPLAPQRHLGGKGKGQAAGGKEAFDRLGDDQVRDKAKNNDVEESNAVGLAERKNQRRAAGENFETRPEEKLGKARKVAPDEAQKSGGRQSPGESARRSEETEAASDLKYADGISANRQDAPAPALSQTERDPDDGPQIAQAEDVYRILLVVRVGPAVDVPAASALIRRKESAEAEASAAEIEADAKQQ